MTTLTVLRDHPETFARHDDQQTRDPAEAIRG
jgi:hypothetical protein